jgi:TrmH family RNA methyltransferase
MPDEIHSDPHQPDPRSTLDEIRRSSRPRAPRCPRRFFVEGVRNVVQAIENGYRIDTLVYSDQLLTVPIARRLVRDRRRSGIPTLRVSPEAFRQVSRTLRASGVGAVVAQRWSPLHGASPRAGLSWVVLEAVRSEGNLGTLIRTSEAVGGAGFILVGPRIDPFDPAVVRASMGALFRQAFIRTTHGSLRTGSVAIAAGPSARRPTDRPSSIASTIPARRSSCSARSAGGSRLCSESSARTWSASRWSARPTP